MVGLSHHDPNQRQAQAERDDKRLGGKLKGPDVRLTPRLDHRLIRRYHCQPMNLYREILPADCPPEAAEEIVSPRIVYRLVDDDPPADADFDSWRVKNRGCSRVPHRSAKPGGCRSFPGAGMYEI